MGYEITTLVPGETITSYTIVVIHTLAAPGTPLLLQIPSPTQVAPAVTVITIPTSTALTTTVPLVVLTEAVFIVVDPQDGSLERFTLQQQAPGAAVESLVTLKAPPGLTISVSASVTEIDASSQAVGASAGTPVGSASVISIRRTTLDASTANAIQTSSATYSASASNTTTTPGPFHPSSSKIGDITAPDTVDKAASPGMTPLDKGKIALFVLLGTTVAIIIVVIVWRLRKHRHAEAGWRAHRDQDFMEAQQRQREDRDWQEKVKMEGDTLTPEQFRERVHTAMQNLERYHTENRAKSKERSGSARSGDMKEFADRMVLEATEDFSRPRRQDGGIKEV